MALLDEEQDPDKVTGPTSVPTAPGQDPLDALKKYLALVPKAPETPRPALPEAPDPEIARAAQERLGTLAGIQGFAGMRTIGTLGAMQGKTPSIASSPGYEAAKHAAELPVQQEATRVGTANKGNEILNKWMEMQAARGVKEQTDVTGVLGKYLQGQNAQGVAATKAASAEKIGAAHDKTKVDTTKLQMGGGSLDPTIVDREADRYNSGDGEIHTPKGLRGPAAIGFVQAVQKRAAEKLNAPGAGPAKPLAQVAAGNKADTASLASSQKLADTTDAQEATASKNLDQFLSVAKNVADTGSPLLNKPVRWLEQNLGDTTVAQFHAARQVAATEVARVLQGGSQLTDSARHEIGDFAPANATGAQLVAVAQIIKKDMANRHAAQQGQLGVIKSRIGGGSAPAAEEMVPVVSPDGRRGKIPASKLDAALKAGYTRG